MSKDLGIKSLQLMQQYRKLSQKKAEGLTADEEKTLREIEAKIAQFLDPRSTESFAQKRKALRVNAEFTVSIADKAEMNKLYIKNISGGGLYIATQESFEMGKKFKILLQLPEQIESFEVDVEVAWLNPKGVGHLPPGVGVKFINLPPNAERQIDRMIDRKVEQKISQMEKTNPTIKKKP